MITFYLKWKAENNLTPLEMTKALRNKIFAKFYKHFGEEETAEEKIFISLVQPVETKTCISFIVGNEVAKEDSLDGRIPTEQDKTEIHMAEYLVELLDSDSRIDTVTLFKDDDNSDSFYHNTYRGVCLSNKFKFKTECK